jgi:hypothetical protein
VRDAFVLGQLDGVELPGAAAILDNQRGGTTETRASSSESVPDRPAPGGGRSRGHRARDAAQGIGLQCFYLVFPSIRLLIAVAGDPMLARMTPVWSQKNERYAAWSPEQGEAVRTNLS